MLKIDNIVSAELIFIDSDDVEMVSFIGYDEESGLIIQFKDGPRPSNLMDVSKTKFKNFQKKLGILISDWDEVKEEPKDIEGFNNWTLVITFKDNKRKQFSLLKEYHSNYKRVEDLFHKYVFKVLDSERFYLENTFIGEDK